MDSKKMKQFEEQLLQKKEAIYSDVERTLSDLHKQKGNIPDPNDRATAESGRNFELRIRDREQKLLNKIEGALERIKNKSFGECEDCGEPIGLKRLEARPVTSLCIECKTRQEQHEKSQGK